MKTVLMSLVTIFSVFLLTSCVTRGEQFSSDYSWIKKGVTSKYDVNRQLGEPNHVGFSSGRRTWTYGHYKYRLVGESFTKELTFYWDDQEKVDNFVFKSSFPEDRRKVLGIPK